MATMGIHGCAPRLLRDCMEVHGGTWRCVRATERVHGGPPGLLLG